MNESTDKTPTENETIALKKEDSDDEKPLPTLAKTLFEEAAQVEQSNVEKPVERRDTDAPVQDQPKAIQNELVDRMVSIFLAFLLNLCSKSQNLIQYIGTIHVKFFFE